jgi:hypothetical protein
MKKTYEACKGSDKGRYRLVPLFLPLPTLQPMTVLLAYRPNVPLQVARAPVIPTPFHLVLLRLHVPLLDDCLHLVPLALGGVGDPTPQYIPSSNLP